jgi:membrane peptidoglycan carboxypeptidase
MSIAEPLAYRPGGSRRLLRFLRRTIAALLGLMVVLVVVGSVYVVTLPSVSAARQRAEQLMASHHEQAGMPVPSRLAAAVIATEDEHFGDNVVLNVATGAGRAGLDLLSGGSNPGGATIDQQLAKRLYGDGGGIGGTLRQIGLGIKLGLHWSHRQVLAMYLNVNYYGNDYWGVRQAAEGYFGVPPAGLTWSEASMLAGLLQAPSAYDPLNHLALAKGRQQQVLAQLVANGKLTRRQAASAYRAKLPLR